MGTVNVDTMMLIKYFKRPEKRGLRDLLLALNIHGVKVVSISVKRSS